MTSFTLNFRMLSFILLTAIAAPAFGEASEQSLIQEAVQLLNKGRTADAAVKLRPVFKSDDPCSRTVAHFDTVHCLLQLKQPAQAAVELRQLTLSEDGATAN